jgi:hypothetical protein
MYSGSPKNRTQKYSAGYWSIKKKNPLNYGHSYIGVASGTWSGAIEHREFVRVHQIAGLHTCMDIHHTPRGRGVALGDKRSILIDHDYQDIYRSILLPD